VPLCAPLTEQPVLFVLFANILQIGVNDDYQRRLLAFEAVDTVETNFTGGFNLVAIVAIFINRCRQMFIYIRLRPVVISRMIGYNVHIKVKKERAYEHIEQLDDLYSVRL